MPFTRPSRRAAAMLAALAVAAPGLAIAASPIAATAADGSVVVNEIWYDGTPEDAIELYNASSESVDVSGWKLQDDKRDASTKGTAVLPEGTAIAPGGFLVLTKAESGPLTFPFGLGKGDAVFLLDPADAVVDEYAYAADSPTSDWSRCADGGAWAHATAVTLGTPNTCDPVEEPATPGSVRLNEIDSGPADWIELVNPGDEALALSGYELRDNSDDHRWFFAAGTTIGAGELLVVEASTLGVGIDGGALEFGDPIGIGGADAIRLYDAGGTKLDEYSWAAHPAVDGSEAAASWARCPDATGPWSLARITKGAANDCVLPSVAINEVESNGDATDWVEVVNTGTTPVDLSGWTLMDGDPIGHAADVTPVESGTTLAPGAFFVFDQNTHFDFGLGDGDTATIRNASGVTIAEHTWGPHAAVTYARCPDGTGAFGDASASTKGAANACGTGPVDPTDPEAAAWPGSPDVTVIDEEPMFLEDSSGLDVQETAEGAFLWAVDNGTGTFWKLEIGADGSATFADGKRARFQKDADDPEADGPDSEGITVDGDGNVYLASERDNSDKGVNRNVVLAVDADAPGPDVVADQEWDLTSSLPDVAANTGIEAVEWVSDDVLAGRLLDATTDAPYDPADYPGHGDGLFFVALEDNGHVYAYALGTDGSIDQVAEIDPGLGGVMALDYDTAFDRLWAVCDNGCEGRAAQIAFTGGEPEVVLFERPAGMPDLNTEGFATAPASLGTPVAAPAADEAPIVPFVRAATVGAEAVEAELSRPVFWFADGERPAALRAGTVVGAVEGAGPGAGGPGAGGPGTGGSGSGGNGSTTGTGTTGAAGLADTGVDDALVAIIPLAVLAVLGGAALAIIGRRRREASAN
ncbi:hypothetical protein GE115_10055 [Agromyces sp. CFH 90414]|uniref:Cell wall protein n=1 Tax=Agromyces agglutinans TaxID=2662258 RepID=A0A6I2F8V5_9MICO|nr:lamin tail domain-containing protein [Agromyces agglutinans]MRG60207.1 hypothetical protein [Agromyces agglutinans]